MEGGGSLLSVFSKGKDKGSFRRSGKLLKQSNVEDAHLAPACPRGFLYGQLLQRPHPSGSLCQVSTLPSRFITGAPHDKAEYDLD
eukprot:5886213-Amphidinium_carterae.1